jgi:cytoskeletal protein CcmA (bactofilin family)
MFGNRKRYKAERVDTLVGQNTRIEGNIHFSGGLHVDGVVKGNVVADSNSTAILTLSENGTIEGDVRVPNIILNGNIIGDVYASDRIELAVQARVNGNVYYNLLEMVMGAEVNGSLVHRLESHVANATASVQTSGKITKNEETLSEIMDTIQPTK